MSLTVAWVNLGSTVCIYDAEGLKPILKWEAGATKAAAATGGLIAAKSTTN